MGTLIRKNILFLILTVLYFVVRIVNLTKIPIFNDEAIYLDWGWRETHVPGFLFYSLYDAKQPFLMWVFGIFESIIYDPLFAGRLVSVLLGFLNLAGIYLISVRLFTKRVAFFSSILYIIIPIFSFYDRQALMESAVASIGIWTFYFFLKLYLNLKIGYAIIIGIILGLGFFIKSSTLIFIFTFLIINLFLILRKNHKKNRINFVLITTLFIGITDFLLIIRPDFWGSIRTNNRYVFTLAELFDFPFSIWSNNFFGNINIVFFFVTPVVASLGLIGLVILIKKGDRFGLLAAWFMLPILIQLLTSKWVSQRYIVSFLPLICIFASFAFFVLFKRFGHTVFIFIFISILIPTLLTFYQIISPVLYFSYMHKLTNYAETNYIYGQTSGYPSLVAFDYLNGISKNQKINIGVAQNSGNPESAMITYFKNNRNVMVGYFDEKQFYVEDLKKIDCIKSDRPLYFVSRNSELVGLDKYLYKVKEVKNPYDDKTSVGIYRLKEKCSGNTITIKMINT